MLNCEHILPVRSNVIRNNIKYHITTLVEKYESHKIISSLTGNICHLPFFPNNLYKEIFVTLQDHYRSLKEIYVLFWNYKIMTNIFLKYLQSQFQYLFLNIVYEMLQASIL